jgi:DNA-directed RNA polymerase subunit K/omega
MAPRKAKQPVAAQPAVAGPPSVETRDPISLMMTKYERTKLIGIRAEQLARGALPYVGVDPGEPFDPCEVAERELAARLLPFVVVRSLPDGKTMQLRMDDYLDDVPAFS